MATRPIQHSPRARRSKAHAEDAVPLRIAVVGAGVAGLTAAHLLDERGHDVTVFERRERLGGHTHTVVIEDGPDAGTPVDTGFIVFNRRNYPLFSRLLQRLRVRTRASDMSFGYFDEISGLTYAGTGLSGLFAQRRKVLDIRYLRFLRGVMTFGERAKRDLEADRLADETLREYVRRLGLPSQVLDDYLVPMGAAIWSSPRTSVADFPVRLFLRFFDNHGLLTLRDRPKWRTVVGGSHSYVKALRERFGGDFVLGAKIAWVRRLPTHVELALEDGAIQTFDAIVLGTHADQALAILEDPTPDERRLLGAWDYVRNDTVLHFDGGVMPPNKRAWASWNYVREQRSGDRDGVSVTYDMNRLQGLKTRRHYLVTLNRSRPIDERYVVRRLVYDHPHFTLESAATQPELPSLNGAKRTWFCGAYFGYGFHEDAVRAGAAVAADFGAEL